MQEPTSRARKMLGNTNAVKIPGQRRVQKQYSMSKPTLDRIAAIRAKTGETASAVIARAIDGLPI